MKKLTKGIIGVTVGLTGLLGGFFVGKHYAQRSIDEQPAILEKVDEVRKELTDYNRKLDSPITLRTLISQYKESSNDPLETYFEIQELAEQTQVRYDTLLQDPQFQRARDHRNKLDGYTSIGIALMLSSMLPLIYGGCRLQDEYIARKSIPRLIE